MQADTPPAERHRSVMDEQPRDPPQQPSPRSPQRRTPAPEPAQPATGWVPPAPEPEPPRGGSRPPTASRVESSSGSHGTGGRARALVFTIFIGGSSDPHDQALEEFSQRLSAIPEFEARYGDVESGDEASARPAAGRRRTGAAARRPTSLLAAQQRNAGARRRRGCAAIMRQTIDGTDARPPSSDASRSTSSARCSTSPTPPSSPS